MLLTALLLRNPPIGSSSLVSCRKNNITQRNSIHYFGNSVKSKYLSSWLSKGGRTAADSLIQRHHNPTGRTSKKKKETMERGKINLTHESKHHHPSHIDSPPPPLACILPPLFARPLLIHINSHNLFKKLLKK
jgi:hypothetical protein